MKFKAQVNDMAKALQKVQGVLRGTRTDKKLNCVEIDARESGDILVSATDIEVTILTGFKGTVEEPGLRLIDGKALFQTVRAMPEGVLSLGDLPNDARIELKSGRTSYKMPVTIAQSPTFYKQPSGTRFKVDAEHLKSILSKTMFASSSDSSRLNLNGVRFEPLKDSLRAITTDGHRLSVAQHAAGFPTEFVPFTLPDKGAEEFIRLLEKDTPTEISFNENAIVLWLQDGTVLISCLLNGAFPDYMQVIPEKQSAPAIINRMSLSEAIRRLTLIGTTKAHGVVFSFGSGTVNLSSADPMTGEASEELEIEYKGRNGRVGFSAAYLLEALQSFDSDKIEFHFSDELSAAFIRPVLEDVESQFSVIMPMRI